MNMTREEIISEISIRTKEDCLTEIREEIQGIRTEHLHWCLDAFDRRVEEDKVKYFIHIRLRENNSIDLGMELESGKFYGISLSL